MKKIPLTGYELILFFDSFNSFFFIKMHFIYFSPLIAMPEHSITIFYCCSSPLVSILKYKKLYKVGSVVQMVFQVLKLACRQIIWS